MKRVQSAAHLHQTGGALEFRIGNETVTFEKPKRGEPFISTSGSGLTENAALTQFLRSPGVMDVLQGALQEAIADANRLIGR